MKAKNYDNPKYKGMLSMMPSECVIDYAEALEDCINAIVEEGEQARLPLLYKRRMTEEEQLDLFEQEEGL